MLLRNSCYLENYTEQAMPALEHGVDLGGDEAFTLAEYAAELATVSGRPVTYQDLPREHVSALIGSGVPEPFAQLLADTDQGASREASCSRPRRT